MSHWPARLVIALALLALGAPALAAPAADDEALLEALTAKAAGLRDYHLRANWERPGDYRGYDLEVWYATPRRMKVLVRYAGGGAVTSEAVLREDESYSIYRDSHEAYRRRLSDGEGGFWRLAVESLPPPYLTADYLDWAGKAQVVGEDVAHDRACRLVELVPLGPRLTGSPDIEDDFVTFIPRTRDYPTLRLWVDDETAMIWRWESAGGWRSRSTGEVIETQHVNGFLFPSLARVEEPSGAERLRITDVTVNQGLADDLFEFKPAPDCLVFDDTLAKDELLKRLEREPDDASLHYTLARRYRDSGQDQDAAREYRRAAELAPNSPAPLLSLATALRREGAAEEAIDAARRGYELSGRKSWRGLLMLGAFLVGAGRTDEAIEYYREALATAEPPRSHWMAGRLADMLARTGDLDGAYRAVADRMPDLIGPWARRPSRLVEWAEKSGHLDDLRQRVEDALAARPDSRDGRMLLVDILRALDRDADALAALKAVPLSESPDVWGTLRIESLARELGDEEFAAEAHGVAIAQAIRYGQPWSALRGEGATQGEAIDELVTAATALWAEAPDAKARADLVGHLRRISGTIEIDTDGSQALRARAADEMTPAECAVIGAIGFAGTLRGGPMWDVEHRLRAHTTACLDRAVAAYPDDAALRAMVGRMRWREAESEQTPWEEVVDAYSKAATADPDNIEYPARLAFARVRLDDCEEALNIATRAIEPWADEWAAKTFLAAAQMDCGRLEAARDALAAVLASGDLRNEQPYLRTRVTGLLVRCHEQLGELDRAVAVLKRDLAQNYGYYRNEPCERLIQFYRRHDRNLDAYATARAYYFEASEDWIRRSVVDSLQNAFDEDTNALAAAVEADLAAQPGDADAVRFASLIHRRMGAPPELLPPLHAAAAKAAKALRAAAGESPDAWREVAEIYLTAEAWDQALAAVERLTALTPETDEVARMRAEVLAARVYAGKRDDHEARRRLIPILARAEDPTLLREAADALVGLYLLREERHQAIATLNDLRLRTQDREVLNWIDQRLNEVGGE